MPVESVPSLRSAGRPAADTPQVLDRLARIELAPGEVVEPLLRSARSAVASLTLQARTAEQNARLAEQATSSDEALGREALEAEQAARLAVVDLDLEVRRVARDAAVEQARLDADALVAEAREDGRAMVLEAREELDRSLGRVPGSVAAPVAAAVPLVTVADLAEGPEPDPAPVVPLEPEPSYPPPAAGPTYPPPSAAPTLPPPMMAAPLGASFAPTFTAVLVQAPDGTLQQMLMLTPAGAPAPAPIAPVAAAPVALPALMPAPGTTQVLAAPAPLAVAPPAPAIPVQEVASSRPSGNAGRRLLHLDVILPLIAVAIVLVVLLAWLG